MKQRDVFLDTLKTILIFLVILGHCLIRLGSDDNIIIDTIFRYIYLIHMPLFVFVSGYLFRPEKSIRESCLGLFSAFVLFQVIWMLIDYPHRLRGFISPAITLWYLLSMCYWRIMIHYLNWYLGGKKMVWFVITAVLFVVAGFFPLTTELSFQRTFAFFPFFVIGNSLRRTNIVAKIRQMNIWIPLASSFLFIILLYFVNPHIDWLLFGKRSYYTYHFSMIIAPFVKIVWFFVSAILCVFFIALLPSNRNIASEGSKTLTIYLFHFFPIFLLQKSGFQTSSIVLLLVISILIYLFTSILHRVQFIRWMTCPIK